MTDPKRKEGWKELCGLAMTYETAIVPLPAEHYLEEFYRFYEIKDRRARLVPSRDGFHGTLKNVSGDDCWKPIAQKAEEFFGAPSRVTILEDDEALREELGGVEGCSPFFFVFDLMFCEYEGFTLCFISGTNN